MTEKKLAACLRAAAVAAHWDQIRRCSIAPCEVWSGVPPLGAHKSLVAALRTTLDQSRLDAALAELTANDVLAPDGGPGRWAVTGHRGLLAVQDLARGDGESPAVYIGPDSLRFVDHLLTQPPAATALEVGSGSGLATAALARAGAAVTGIDVVPQAVTATALTARLNGVGSRVRAVHSALAEFEAEERYALVIANLPGVPVPPGVRYSSAGDGGPDGLRLIRELIGRLPGLLAAEGRVVMRFQTLAGPGGLLIGPYLRETCAAQGCDADVVVEARVPVTLRAALTAHYAAGHNLGRSEADLYGVAKRHLLDSGATHFTACCLTTHPHGNGQVTIRDLAAIPTPTLVLRSPRSPDTVGQLMDGESQIGAPYVAAYYGKVRDLPDEFWEVGGGRWVGLPLARVRAVLGAWETPRPLEEVCESVFSDEMREGPVAAAVLPLAVGALAVALTESGILVRSAEDSVRKESS
jgi:SAM-dependent methyltransferase